MAKKDKKNPLPGDGATPEQDRMSRYGVRRESKKVKKREAVIRILLIILVLLLIFLSVMFGCSSYINERREYDVIKQNIDSILQTGKQPERGKETERG